MNFPLSLLPSHSLSSLSALVRRPRSLPRHTQQGTTDVVVPVAEVSRLFESLGLLDEHAAYRDAAAEFVGALKQQAGGVVRRKEFLRLSASSDHFAQLFGDS